MVYSDRDSDQVDELENFSEITEQATNLLRQESPQPIEIRKILLEIDDLINSNEYHAQPEETRQVLQNLRRELKEQVKRLDNNIESAPSIQVLPDIGDIFGEVPHPEAESEREGTSPSGYNPDAEANMEEAEKLFYSGRYADAVRLFDRVIHLEPKWERARQHRIEAENYLRTGYIPPVALPSEAASAYGKAQSAARVGRYEDALQLLQKAQSAMRESGIQRWQEGLDFEQKLQENIDAEKVYREGVQYFSEGRIEEAIERVESASRATGLPKFRDRAQSFRRIRDKIRSIHEILSSLTFDPKAIGQSKVDLDLMLSEYGSNPAFERLLLRLQTAIPKAITPLKEQARTLKSKSERADTLVDALSFAQQARNTLDEIKQLSETDESIERLQDDVDRLVKELQNVESGLNTARMDLQNHPNWPIQAYKLSQEARARFPQDPQVQFVNRSLNAFKFMRSAVLVGIGIFGFAMIFLLGKWGVDRYQSFQLARTPSATPTFTPTPTPLPTGTPTATGTWTSTPTATFTATPTPIFGFAMRDIWARNGCYENFTATGRIPVGGEVVFLTPERRFDQFNRECALVEFNAFGRSIIGWILLLDISPVEVTPGP